MLLLHTNIMGDIGINMNDSIKQNDFQDLDQLWSNLLATNQQIKPFSSYTRLIALKNGLATVQANSAPIAAKLGRLQTRISQDLSGLTGQSVRVEFAVRENGLGGIEEVEEVAPDMPGNGDISRVRDRRKPKRLYIDNVFFRKGYARQVGPYGIAIYAALALHADNDTQEAWPSYNRLATLTNMSRRQAIKKVKELKDLNIVEVENRKDGKLNDTNIVILLDDEYWKNIKSDLSY